MAQHDMNIANQSFPSFRTDLNNSLSALNSMHSGTSRPSGATTGTMWLDTTNSGSNSLTIKFFDGSDDITFATVNTSANTVDFTDSSVTFDIVNDTSPQLGGDLDTNSNNIKIDDAHFIADDDGNEQIIFQKTGSAVNELEVTNAATGNPPILGASGETNVDLHIKPKGSGEVVIGTGAASATLTTSGTHDLVLDTNSGTNSGNITITDGANGAIDLTTNGTGEIKFNDMAYVPQQALTSSSNAVAWDAQAKSNAVHVTTENTTFAAPSNSVEGAFICLEINYNGSHTIAWNTVFEFAASTEPTTTDTDAKTDIFVFRYNGAVWQEVGRTLNLSES
jgi:hypothetical protein